MFRYTTVVFSIVAVCCYSLTSAAVIGNQIDKQDEPASENGSKGSPFSELVESFKMECEQQTDTIACIKVKVLNLLEDVMQKGSFKTSETVSIVPNEKDTVKQTSASGKEEKARSTTDGDFFDHLESYVEKHDLLVKTPTLLGGATFRISPRNLDNNEINMSVQLPKEDENQVSQRSRKHKLKKILVPIVVFVLLKAMTLIPLAIGVLSLKAFNALKLSFISFIISISLAMFQLFKKVASDPPAQISAHIPFESYPSHYAASAAAAARNLIVEPASNMPAQPAEESSQNLAYRAYAKNETPSL